MTSIKSENSSDKNNIVDEKIITKEVIERKELVAQSNDNNTDKKKEKKKWTVGHIITTVLFWLLVAILVTVVGFLMAGYRPAIVLSGSMRPTIQPGDVTVYHSIAPKDLKVGDIVMYHGTSADQSTITNVTHRLIGFKATESGEMTDTYVEGVTKYFVTKGDANQSADGPHTLNQLSGKVEFWIPWIGIPLNWIRNNLLVVMFGAISLIVLSYIISIFIKGKKENTNNNDAGNNA